MGILFTTHMGFLFTITMGILFTIVLGIQFTISNWLNINERIMSKEVLSSGGIFSGSAVFIVEEQISNLQDILELRLVISDYLGNKSIRVIRIDQSMFIGSQKRFRVIDKEFTENKNQKIEFLDKNV